MQIRKGRQSAPQKVPTVNGSTYNYKSHYSLWGLQMRIIKHNRSLLFYFNLILSAYYLLFLNSLLSYYKFLDYKFPLQLYNRLDNKVSSDLNNYLRMNTHDTQYKYIGLSIVDCYYT